MGDGKEGAGRDGSSSVWALLNEPKTLDCPSLIKSGLLMSLLVISKAA